MFVDAHKHAAHYGCTIYNLSSRKGGIEVFERTTEIKKVKLCAAAKKVALFFHKMLCKI
ncbi:MAG: hypothetical protein CM15mP59_2360 [Flavobacteriaceae bacterium]|nr:MAG: hypothetical protein CM15mP59_2360 [Flavobacteriaceae bacterium]